MFRRKHNCCCHFCCYFRLIRLLWRKMRRLKFGRVFWLLWFLRGSICRTRLIKKHILIIHYTRLGDLVVHGIFVRKFPTKPNISIVRVIFRHYTRKNSPSSRAWMRLKLTFATYLLKTINDGSRGILSNGKYFCFHSDPVEDSS